MNELWRHLELQRIQPDVTGTERTEREARGESCSRSAVVANLAAAERSPPADSGPPSFNVGCRSRRRVGVVPGHGTAPGVSASETLDGILQATLERSVKSLDQWNL